MIMYIHSTLRIPVFHRNCQQGYRWQSRASPWSDLGGAVVTVGGSLSVNYDFISIIFFIFKLLGKIIADNISLLLPEKFLFQNPKK